MPTNSYPGHVAMDVDLVESLALLDLPMGDVGLSLGHLKHGRSLGSKRWCACKLGPSPKPISRHRDSLEASPNLVMAHASSCGWSLTTLVCLQ